MKYDRYVNSLKKYARNKHFLIALIVATVASLALIWMNSYATAYLDNQHTELRQEQAKMLKAVNTVPDPANIDPKNANPETTYIIDSTDKATQSAESAAESLRYSLIDKLMATFSGQYSAKELHENDKRIRKSSAAIAAELARYNQVLTATERFIEYDAKIDTAELSLGSADSNERMERLRQGLSKAEEDIDKIAGSSLANDVKNIIYRAQTTQKELESNGDTDNFVDKFEQLQAEYVELIDTHHDQMIPALRQQSIDTVHLLDG